MSSGLSARTSTSGSSTISSSRRGCCHRRCCEKRYWRSSLLRVHRLVRLDKPVSQVYGDLARGGRDIFSGKRRQIGDGPGSGVSLHRWIAHQGGGLQKLQSQIQGEESGRLGVPAERLHLVL